jgi:hypothetical protein
LRTIFYMDMARVSSKMSELAVRNNFWAYPNGEGSVKRCRNNCFDEL